MTTEVERRHQQRFPFQMELAILPPTGNIATKCVTRDVSSGGVYFYTDGWDDSVSDFQFYAALPREITLGSTVTAKCSATVVRVERNRFSKIGVAARIECWAVM